MPSLTDDPTLDEMRQALKFIAAQLEASQFDIEGACYWFAVHHHGGQWSNLYSAQCQSDFRPGPTVEGPETEVEQMLYDHLVEITGVPK